MVHPLIILSSKFLTQEHDDLIKGLLLLREYYKTEYKKALQDKIEKQKKTFQQRQAYLEEEAKLSQELEVMCRLFQRDFPIRNKYELNKKQVMKAKLLFCSKRGGTKFLISFQDRLYLMTANSRVEHKLT